MVRHIETCFNYVDKDVGFFSSDEQKWINRIYKLKEQYPDQVTILREPEENDGCIYCRLPSSWLRIRPKIERELSEEQRQEMRDRLSAYRNSSEFQNPEFFQ